MKRSIAQRGSGRLLLTALSLTGFVTSFGAYIVASNLPAYSRETGAGLIVIGFLIALYDIAEIIAKPLSGVLAARFGEWRMLRFGLLFFSFGSGLYLFLPPGWIVLVRLLQGVGAAFFSVMSMTLLIRCFSEKKGTALGIYGAFKSAGYVVAPTLGGAVVYVSGFQSVFLLCAAAGLIVLGLTYRISSGAAAGGGPGQVRRRKPPSFRELLHSVHDRKTLPVFLIMFFNMIFMAAFFGFMPVLLAEKGFTPVRAGVALAVFASIYLACQPAAGKLSDVFGRKRLIAAGLGVSTLSAPLLPMLPHPIDLLSAGLMAIGIGCVSPLGEALVGDISDPETLPFNLGIAGSYRELGEMAGPISIGFVGQIAGLSSAFLLVGFAGGLGLVCLGLLKESRMSNVEGRKLSGLFSLFSLFGIWFV